MFNLISQYESIEPIFKQTNSQTKSTFMIFGVDQVIAFFEDNDQMGLSHCTRSHIQSEGIFRPDYLIDFTASDSWNKINKNCKRTARVTDPNNAGQKISQKAFQFPDRSLMRLKVAAVAVDYYPKTSRLLTAANIMWDQRLKNSRLRLYPIWKGRKGMINHLSQLYPTS